MPHLTSLGGIWNPAGTGFRFPSIQESYFATAAAIQVRTQFGGTSLLALGARVTMLAKLGADLSRHMSSHKSRHSSSTAQFYSYINSDSQSPAGAKAGGLPSRMRTNLCNPIGVTLIHLKSQSGSTHQAQALYPLAPLLPLSFCPFGRSDPSRLLTAYPLTLFSRTPVTGLSWPSWRP